jgi:hypothetical protein
LDYRALDPTTPEPAHLCMLTAVVPVDRILPGGVTALIASQPHSRGKVEAAWHMAVGGPMARLSTPVRDNQGVVYVRAADAGVAGQLDMHRRVIEARLREVLGANGRTFVVI